MATGLTLLAGFSIGCQREQGQKTEEPGPTPTLDGAALDSAARSPKENTAPSMAPHARIAPTSASTSISVPDVKLSEGQADLCKVNVKDKMPPMLLPDLKGKMVDLSSLYGKHLTVVCFWKGDLAFARSELADLGPDVVEPYGDQGVNVVGVAVGEAPDSAALYAKEAGFSSPTLLDKEGSAFALVGAEKLPRTYLLDADGTIIWFDIEYSRSTRRDLQTAIRAALSPG